VIGLRPRLAVWLVAFLGRHPQADPRPGIRWADQHLRPLGPRLLPLVRQLASRPEPLARWYAGRAAGWLPAEHAAAVWPLLERLATDPDRTVREGAHLGAADASQLSHAAWIRLRAWAEDPRLKLRRAAVVVCLPHLRHGTEEARAQAEAILQRLGTDPRLRSLVRRVRERAASPC
jgi:HEAT repeat protein